MGTFQSATRSSSNLLHVSPGAFTATALQSVLTAVLVNSVPMTGLRAAERVDYSSEVRPLLSDRCFVCHGPDSNRREAGLRLDQRDAAYEYAIVPGDPDASEVIHRIYSTDPDMIMPPPDSNLELSAEERDILRRWIATGAEYDEHWAFVPVGDPEVDPVEFASHENPIDYFVNRKLQTQGLEPQPPADAVTLIRRLSFDLTGLPPAVQQVEEFLADEREDRYERLVDRLLSSPRFGERMAVDWLDVARYADTYGYQNDRYRAMWPWRDWVIRAFNENLPYDKFITWQLAGDLLPQASRDQILATAFNRNHRQTNEGGSVEDEFRKEYVADRVNTFGAAFLGLTLECCRCHDHKYDPITQPEYYQLAAFFNSIDESGLYSHFTEATPTPTLMLSSEEQDTSLRRLHRQIEAKQAELELLEVDESAYQEWLASWNADSQAPFDAAKMGFSPAKTRLLLDDLETSLSADCLADYSFDDLHDGKLLNRVSGEASGKTADNPLPVPGKVGQALQMSGDNKIAVPEGGGFTRNQAFTVSLWIRPSAKFERAVVWHRSRAWTDSGSRGIELLIENGKPSAALIHFWPGNAVRVMAKRELPTDRWSKVCVVYDGSSRAAGLEIFVDGQKVEVEIVRDQLTKHIKGADGVAGGEANELTVGQRFRDVGFKDSAVDELRIFDRALTPLEVQYLFARDNSADPTQEMLGTVTEELLREYFRTQQSSFRELNSELHRLREERSQIADAIPEIMVMRELPQPRPTYVLERGAYDSPGERVYRGTPEALLPRDHGQAPNRLDLARWLVDPEHPLTSRVAVNRFWQMLFGQGLVSTPEDFGLQGSLPSHPELLDWLAHEFMQSGWDVKRLLKTLVMSEAYRRNSDLTTELLQADPENIFLARGPAVRLPAEMIRDTALFASGLLDQQAGGPPAKPYQPEGLWKEKSGQVYRRDPGAGSHRRSLYTFWKRTSPPPSMMTWDANNREVCTVRRQTTMTPMQMLVLLNDPQYVEAARSLAQEALSKYSLLQDQLRHLFRALVARHPETQELAVLTEMYREQVELFASQPEDARELLQGGDVPTNPELDQTTLAAMTVVAEGLMTYDETVMKR